MRSSQIPTAPAWIAGRQSVHTQHNINNQSVRQSQSLGQKRGAEVKRVQRVEDGQTEVGMGGKSTKRDRHKGGGLPRECV